MNDILVQNKEIISVGELNRSAKMILESNFSSVSVLGEISNLAQPGMNINSEVVKLLAEELRAGVFAD